MKKILLTLLGITLIISAVILIQQKNETRKIENLRAQHQEFLDNSPFKETQRLSRKERKALGLPPNAYNEQVWELTMDPETGRPMPERTMEIQEELRSQNNFARGVGGETANPWVDRGPNNQGGRTRAVMFDPNDSTNSRVFAGGVSGGLWVNDDITDANSSWTQVTSMQSNISVTVMIADPNDSNTFYIGSGESYTQGSAVGRGVWKSTDAGVTWTNIFGGFTSTSGQFVNGIFYINDLVARDNNGTTELYAAVASAFYQFGVNQFSGLNEMGLYKSTDGGNNWSRFNITHPDTSFKNPNDIELDINNNIWFTTTSNAFGNPGGDIYRSTDGTTFTLEATIPNAARTELEPSQTDANKFWVAANVSGQANLYRTTNAFATLLLQISEPNDADNGIPATDYTRGQAFYDLPIEADSNDNLYVGGIDTFRSTDDGDTWTQISKWSNNPNLNTLNVPFVHADIHAIVFRPGNENQGLIGSDGGVSYVTSFSAANNDPTAINDRNTEYNTIQFYYGSITEGINGAADDLAGGTQDNGTQFVYDAAAGTSAFFDPVGGDGGFTELISGPPFYAITTYPRNTHVYLDLLGGGYVMSSQSGGNFINEAALDKSLNILYCNATSQTFGNRIERNANFQGGSAFINRTILTDALLNSNPSAFKVSPYTTTSTTLMVGLRNGRLLRLDNADGTPTWNNITGSGFVGSISDIEFGQSEQEIFVTMHNYGVTSIWYSDDGGASWSSIEGNLPDVPVKCILQNPLIPEELIIGTELGIWATGDFTATTPTWEQAQNGMNDVTVLDLDLRTSDNVILATTHGRGFFTSQFTAIPLSREENTIANTKINIFPKVSNGSITISSNDALGEGNIEIFNLSGQKVYTQDLNLSNYQNRLQLNLSSGIYVTKINGDSFTLTDKIIIK